MKKSKTNGLKDNVLKTQVTGKTIIVALSNVQN